MSHSDPVQYPRTRPIEAKHIGELIAIAYGTNLSAWSAQNYLDEFQIPESIMLRLETEANETIGFIVGRTVQHSIVEGEIEAEIYNIAVIPSQQRNGFGQQLFDAFLSKCKTVKVSNIWLEVRASNQKAINFYECNGFEHVQSRNNFYENPREHALLMKLTVRPERT